MLEEDQDRHLQCSIVEEQFELVIPEVLEEAVSLEEVGTPSPLSHSLQYLLEDLVHFLQQNFDLDEEGSVGDFDRFHQQEIGLVEEEIGLGLDGGLEVEKEIGRSKETKRRRRGSEGKEQQIHHQKRNQLLVRFRPHQRKDHERHGSKKERPRFQRGNGPEQRVRFLVRWRPLFFSSRPFLSLKFCASFSILPFRFLIPLQSPCLKIFSSLSQTLTLTKKRIRPKCL